MKIVAFTDKPQQLVNAIDKAIKDEVLKTWGKSSNDKSETLYSHTPEQWNEKAMFKPSINDDNVSFVINWWKKDGEPNEDTKGYILGRFTEILMVHFKNYFQYLEIRK